MDVNKLNEEIVLLRLQLKESIKVHNRLRVALEEVGNRVLAPGSWEPIGQITLKTLNRIVAAVRRMQFDLIEAQDDGDGLTSTYYNRNVKLKTEVEALKCELALIKASLAGD